MASWTCLSPSLEPEKWEAQTLQSALTPGPFSLVTTPHRTGSCPQARAIATWISCPKPRVLGTRLNQVPSDSVIRPQRIGSQPQARATVTWTSWHSTLRPRTPECPLKLTPQPGLGNRVQMSDGRPWVTASWTSSPSLVHSGARDLDPVLFQDRVLLVWLGQALQIRSG